MENHIGVVDQSSYVEYPYLNLSFSFPTEVYLSRWSSYSSQHAVGEMGVVLNCLGRGRPLHNHQPLKLDTYTSIF